MNNQEAINVLFNEWKCIDRNDGIHCDRKCETCDLVMDVEIIREAYNMAISALEAQEAKTQLSAEGTTTKVKKTCITCKHYPPESKLPCIDCDMRNPADRWEPQEVKNSTESSLTQNALDTISRQAAISELMEWVEKEEKKSWSTFKGLFHWTGIKAMLECLPSAQQEIVRCKECKHRASYWGNCKLLEEKYHQSVLVDDDGFCSMAERRTDNANVIT